MYRETPLCIEQVVDDITWVYVGQLNRALRFLRGVGVESCLFAGQIRQRRLFSGLRPDWRALRVLRSLRERNAHTIFGALVQEFARDGITVLPATTFLEDHLAEVGVLGRVSPNASLMRDIDFGTRIAREVSRLEIGQTVVVRRGTVLAVEGFEGTDKAIRRGGELGHRGATVVKVAKPNHDLRFDVPCVGLRTIASCRLARVRGLAVHAGRTLIMEREKVVRACDDAGIALVGIDLGDALDA
jgi:DUF1009 family protein